MIRNLCCNLHTIGDHYAKGRKIEEEFKLQAAAVLQILSKIDFVLCDEALH